MCKVFSVIWNQYGTQNKKECSGYAESCQLSAELVKKGIFPKIEIQYINDD